MSLLLFYAIFAIATSLTALYELVLPVIYEARKESGKDPMPAWLLVVVFFCINILVAPLVFLSCIIPSFGDRFRSSLKDGLYPID